MIPKSYSVQDGCHNCKNCYKTTRFYCNIDKEKEEKNITIDSLQIDNFIKITKPLEVE